MICPQCRGLVDDDDTFCVKCGQPLKSHAAAPVAASAPQPISPPAPLVQAAPILQSVPVQQPPAPAIPAQFVPQQSGLIRAPASASRRFSNLILDIVFAALSGGLVGFLYGFIFTVAHLPVSTSASVAIGVLVPILYYILFESFFQRTLGKMITGTKVVSTTGGKAGFGAILGRTFSRLIPFEVFSFMRTAP